MHSFTDFHVEYFEKVIVKIPLFSFSLAKNLTHLTYRLCGSFTFFIVVNDGEYNNYNLLNNNK